MKKKLIIGALALSMCLSFASCDKINGILDGILGGDGSSSSSTVETEYDVVGAADALYGSLVDQNEETRVDYEVPNTITYVKNVYTITWSVDVEGVVLVKGENATKVDVDENAQADVAYVLTAVVTDPNGETETVEFERKVLQALAYAPEDITAKPVESKAYKLYVYQSTKNADCYFTGNMSGFYYATSEDYAEGVDVKVEYKEGSETEFYLSFESSVDGKQYITIEEGWNSKSSHWTFNPKITSEAKTAFVYSEEYKTIVTTIFARSDADYKVETAEPSVNTTVYLGNYASNMTFSVSNVSYLGKEGNNVGNLVDMINKNEISAEDKVAFEKETLSLAEKYNGNATVELSVLGNRYKDVTIAWAEESDNLAISADGKTLTITEPAAQTTVTVTATLTCGNVTDTKEFTLILSPSLDTPAKIVDAAYALAENESLSGTYTLTGVISSVDDAFSSQHNNVTVTIKVEGKEDKPIKCFRMIGAGADVIKVGDTITVTGTLKNYNGTIEFDTGCTLDSYVPGTGEGGETGGETPDTPAEPETYETLTIPEVLAHEVTDTKFYVSGKITGYYGDNYATYGNVYIQDEKGNELLVYGLFSADGSTRYDAMETKPVIGDTIKVLSVISSYNNVNQLKNAWLIEHTPGSGGETPDTPAPTLPEADSVITIEQAITIGTELAQDTTTENKYYVIGKITAITNADNGQFTIEDENGKSIKVYKSFNSTGEVTYGEMENKPIVGDTVKLYSVVSNYYGPQLKNAWIMEVTVGEHETVELPVEGKAYYLKADKLTVYAQSVSGNGKYLVTGETAGPLSFTFEKVADTENQYYIKLSTGKYLSANTAKDNNISASDTPCAWIFNTTTKQIQLAEDTQYCLQYNSSSPRISRYKGTQINVWFEEVPAATEA